MLPLLARGTPEERRSFHVETVTPPQTVRKPPRKQVSRACEHCRVRRVKCDQGRPCRPCRQKGLECNSRGKHNDEARTLPQALREIERLRIRVEELEAELKEARHQQSSVSVVAGTSLPTPSQLTPSTKGDQPTNPHSSSRDLVPPTPKVEWEGIYTATARSEQTSYYGPSSAFYFVGRIGSFLSQTLQQSFHLRSMQPRGVNKTLDHPNSPGDVEPDTAHRTEAPRPSMSRTQEEYFLNLFWESHHTNTPVIDEGAFRKHYNELWQNSRPYRKPSALVDIVLAVSMQYGWAFLLQDTAHNATRNGRYDDASIAGRWYYRRCQSLIAAELESPSVTTLQCHLLSVVYLCCASFQNMAHTALAVAVRTAQILGLHLEPLESMPHGERELRKRIWWVVYTIEVKTCMKLGRPFSVQKSQTTVSMPSDSVEAASLCDSTLESYDNEVTWLTYSCQTQTFVATTVDVYNDLYDKCSEILGQRGQGSFYKDAGGLEACAKFLATLTPSLEAWVHQVPGGLKLKRRGDGEAFSTDRSAIAFEASAPLWLQRNRICLELIYHTMYTNLYRPFINFTPSSSTYAPTAERHAAACVNHAIAHTHIMHQVLKETDLMNGWQEFFQWQWNATVNMVGFVLAYPINPVTARARETIEKAIEVFEVYGSNFAVAASAASVTRDLAEKANLLVSRLRSGITAEAGIGADSRQDASDAGDVENSDGLALEGDGLAEFMDWALTVDSFNSFEDLFANANDSMEWWGVGPL
ncbi:fungal-specific transcription factor domain-containing protein [Ilyonectria robusta]|uniref:fungal-specific transcription factor domain-containing protein n=1 Tax=Ilyonectria robusta TaxID=1079257 RepID=UPI001E8CF69F|nr:fungal-specific transcription factor domain-containing protein [Ilyonectria robusta]KAH8736399.1 fungal-specific transcription factor domain-containing protein [Ilyonectria robusta]